MAKFAEDAGMDQIAALKKKVAHKQVNLLEPGPGTPWEDRGSAGAVGAFFKTVAMALSAPRRLLALIRRPETPGDARVLTIIYGVFWGLGWWIQDFLGYQKLQDPPRGQDPMMMSELLRVWLIHMALAVGGAWVLLNLVTQVFHKLVSQGQQGAKAPPVLIYNVFAYLMAPSLFALIPFGIGPAVAVVWIVLLWATAGSGRLGLTFGNGLVCTLISAGLVLGGAVGVYFGVLKLLSALGYV
ncbi:MAG: hypothetical protein ACAI43_08815 [Phycisphaerae bacterium]|nr:hypothetical protein [Tepidisphaeraceae bacterium]